MSARLTSPRLSALCLASLLAMASTCEQCQPVGDPRRGNVDRVSDVVVVAAADGHSYAVSANPELQHLRVLDLTDGRFLTAPNRFFPLSIPVGRETRRLATAVDARTQADDPTRIYALDSADDKVQIVRVTDDAGVTAFDVVKEAEAGRAPVDLAALRLTDDTVVVAVSLPDSGALRLLTLVDDGLTGSVDIDLTAAQGGALAHPGAVVADPLGRAFVVGDAVQPVVIAIEIDASAALVGTRVVDVGGPVQELAAGVVDVGDGLAPVVLALRSDTAAAMLVRLFRPGFVEDRYALLGGTALPTPGAVAYVPDARPSAAPVTVCCRGLSSAQIAAGEATAAFASVTLIDGRVLHLQLAAATLDGVALEGDRRLVRLVDDDPAPPGPSEGLDVNTEANLWVPPAGGEALRPTVSFTTVDNLGSPPFVPLVQPGGSLLLVWEGELPLAVSLGGVFAPGPRTFEVSVDLARRGVRAGDLARLVPESQRVGCATSFDARVLAVTGGVLSIAFEGDGSDQTPAVTEADSTGCLQGAGDVRLTVLVADAFVVTEGGAFRGRLRFGADVVDEDSVDSADGRVELAGVRVTVQAAGAGKPLPGSRLALPLDARVTTLGLDLEAGFGTAAQVPTGIAGGTLIIPDAEDATARVPARRVIMSTSGLDARSGLPGLLTCDEAETRVAVVERFN